MSELTEMRDEISRLKWELAKREIELKYFERGSMVGEIACNGGIYSCFGNVLEDSSFKYSLYEYMNRCVFEGRFEQFCDGLSSIAHTNGGNIVDALENVSKVVKDMDKFGISLSDYGFYISYTWEFCFEVDYANIVEHLNCYEVEFKDGTTVDDYIHRITFRDISELKIESEIELEDQKCFDKYKTCITN